MRSNFVGDFPLVYYILNTKQINQGDQINIKPRKNIYSVPFLCIEDHMKYSALCIEKQNVLEYSYTLYIYFSCE